MSGYTKLFSSILASTIWRSDDKTRIVWITLLAMADRRGIAEGSVPGLADFARVSVPACRRALAILSAPDTDSRSDVADGRRIKAVPGGWQLINYGYYRQKLNADERREYLKTKQREYRQRRQQLTASTRRKQTSTMYRTRQQRTHIAEAEAVQDQESARACEEATTEERKDVLAERAGRFIERFTALYPTLRSGAHYIPDPRDYEATLKLCAAYDDAWLDNLSQVWLKTDAHWSVKKHDADRGIRAFSRAASWCDEQLRVAMRVIR